MENIKNLIKRIGAEAETVEDMEQLLLSELDAYDEFRKDDKKKKLYLYPETEVYESPLTNNGLALVGEFYLGAYKYYIALEQKLINHELKTKYITHIH